MPESEQETPQEIIPVETEMEAPVVKNAPVSAPPPAEKPSPKPAGTGLGRFLKGLFLFLLRLTVTLIILGVLAIGVAYLAPLVYERYVRPVEMNAAQVAALQSQQAQSAEQIASLQARLATAEAGQTQQVENITELTGRLQSVESGIAEHTQKLAALDEMQSQLIKANEASLLKMNNQIELLKALETLSRARLFLYQSNFGLARQDAQSAYDILAELQEKASTPELKEAVFRLDLVLKNLPDFPVPASNDLDLAWLALVGENPSQTSAPSESSTPTLVPTESATPTPVTNFTSTPVQPVTTPTTKP
jgi:Tfp pilus assembly protein PilE